MRRIFLGSLLAILMLPGHIDAWTLSTERALAKSALELAPPALDHLVNIHHRSFDQGLLDAARHEQQQLEVHLGSDRTALERFLRTEIDEAVQIMKERRPIEDFVYQLGVIAHFAGDLNNPFHIGSNPELDERRVDYEQYLERRQSRFPTVFYGIERDRVIDRVIRRSQLRARSYSPLLHYEYFGKGEERWSRQFDDRSTAFAIASLSWSHSISDLVNIYYEVWRRAGGDVRKAARLRPGVVKGGRN